MGLGAVIAPRSSTSCQNLQLHTDVPQSNPRYNIIWSSKPPASSAISFQNQLSRRNMVVSGCGLLSRPSSPFFWTSCNLKGGSFKQYSCGASNFDEFSDEELSNQIEELQQKLNLSNHEEESNRETACLSSKGGGLALPLPRMEVDILQPSMLGIQPDPPENWPERREIISYLSFVRKSKSVELPFSIGMLRRKQKQLEEFTYCSVNKAFSSMVFIVRELQSYALSIRGSLYCEDLEEIIGKVQREINASFIWLFTQVFSRTPSLMVYVMILLANFSVYSMANNAVVAATPLPAAMSETPLDECVSETEKKPAVNATPYVFVKKTIPIQYPSNIVQGEMYGGDWFGKELMMGFVRDQEEELGLWKSVVEEASRMHAEMRDIEALDHETMKRLVAPVSVEIEADDRDPYFRTDLSYQIGLLQEPDNPLLLFNYAQFLYLVAHDHDR